ncbi:hypothetical protein QA597_00670 [Marinilabiliaceae bacterium ANBcel2]|nr:hypothetical protein [Marinilabiliaceae bacterium ANBcel2]
MNIFFFNIVCRVVIVISLTISAIYLSGCNVDEDPMDKPVVTVGNSSLTIGELKSAIPENISHSDSVAVAEDYIGRWVQTKLFLLQAESNLTQEEKDVERLLDEYRTSLLVHMYQQKLLQQKHAPLITTRDIENYYEEMKDNFTLQENIFKGVFLKIPLDAPNQNIVKEWAQSDMNEDLINIEAYAIQYANTYEQYTNRWIPFNRVIHLLPQSVNNVSSFLRRYSFYEYSDSQYNYYLAIHNFVLAGDYAPVSYVEDRIKAILLNKKRKDFIDKMSKELYEEALQNKIVNFH